MKKLLALAAMLIATAASAQVSGTKHNMANAGYAGAFGTGDVCYYCHVAHNGTVTAPLWGRGSPAALTPYTSATVTPILAANIDGVSQACMSCHDGVTDVGLTIKQDFSGAAIRTMADVPVGFQNINANIGQSLGNDHPVSMTWNATKAGLGATTAAAITAGFQFYGGANDQITCATCHTVHNNVNTKFLRVAVTGAFCGTCHSAK